MFKAAREWSPRSRRPVREQRTSQYRSGGSPPSGGLVATRRCRSQHGLGAAEPDLLEEQAERPCCNPLPPGSAIYPVGDLGRSLRGVAPDRADEPRIADDRPKPVLRGGHDLRHVGVEGASIARVFGCECRHAHRLRVAHLLEDRVEIRSLHRTKRKLRHETKRRSAGRARGPRSDAGRPDRGTPRDGRSGAGRRPAPRCRPAPARPRPARPAGSRGRA